MKKISYLFFSFLIIFTLVSCFDNGSGDVPPTPGPNPQEHVCSYGEWTTYLEGNCYEKGEERRYCSGCDKYESRVTDYKHNYVTVEALEPTCTSSGHNEYQECTACFDKKGYQYIDPIEHSNFYYEKYDSIYHLKHCGVCDGLIESLQHNFDAGVRTEPTCTEDGFILYTCTDCGYSYSETIYSQGHTPGDEATCTKNQICTVCEEVLNEAFGHTLVYGTCEEDIYCFVCEEVIEEAPGHTSSGDATCTEHEYCTVCFENIENPHHTFVDGVCSECGELELTANLELELDFDTEYFYRVLGISTSASYVVIPNVYNGLPVKEIENEAFRGDQVLEKVYIPDNVEYVGLCAFYDCPNLEAIFIGNTVKPKTTGVNWSGNARIYYEGEYNLTGNVATSTIVDNEANNAYDLYVFYKENLADNYTLDFDHTFNYVVPNSATIINTGEILMKSSGETRYAQEELSSVMNISGMGNSGGVTDKTTEYYNNGYLYSHVSVMDGQTITNNNKTYCVLPISQFIKDSLTLDVVTPSRSDFAKAVMVDNGSSIVITLSTANGYTPAEFAEFINCDKIALNMDISGILASPDAQVSVVYTINKTTLAISIEFDMSVVTAEGTMSYTNNSFYTNVGTTQGQYCPNISDYVQHIHNAETNTCGEVVCQSCNLVIQEASDHIFNTSNCESNKCTVCGEVVETGKHHIYSEGECIYCGLKQASKNLKFELSSDGTYYILVGIGTCGSKNIVIPEIYEGLPVKEIAGYAFDNSKMTSLYIPSSIEIFGYNILGNCNTLESITFADFDKIYDYGISNILGYNTCEIIKEIIIESGVKVSGFEGYTNLEKVVLPDNLESIYSNAFNGCSKLSDINLPEGLVKIGSSAFYGCVLLEDIIIPTTVTEISYNAFGNCNIKELIIDLSVFNSSAFPDLAYSIVEITLTGTGSISDYMFEDSTTLEVVDLPADLTAIGEFAFADCTALKTINIPGNLTDLGASAFEGCTALESIVFEEGLLEIGEAAFAGCTKLQTISLPVSLTTIGAYAFKGCSTLAEVVVPTGTQLSKISMYAFADCPLITEAISFEGIQVIGMGAYSNTGVKEVYIPSTLSYSNPAYQGCDIEKLEVASSSANVKNILDGCNSIEEITFNGNAIGSFSVSELPVKKVIINESVENIKYNAFYNCTELETVEILGSGLITIENAAFMGCTSLTKINLPSSIESINSYAIVGNQNLNIYYEGTIDDWCGVSTNEEGSSSLSVLIENHNFYIKNSSNQYVDVKTITELVISDTVTKIEYGQLYGFVALESISLPAIDCPISDLFGGSENVPASLKKVEITSGTTLVQEMFANISSIEEVVIGDSITEIGRRVFNYECSNIKKITIPFVGDSFEQASETYFHYLFGGSSYNSSNVVPQSLKEVVVTNATGVFNLAFYNCQYIEKVVLENVESINFSLFKGCSSLTSIVMPKVTRIDDSGFENCTGLTEIKLPEGLTYIGEYAFKGCTSLVNLTLPSTLEEVDYNAFENCSLLENVYFDGDIEDWCGITFANDGIQLLDIAENIYFLNGTQYEEPTMIEVPNTIEKINGYQFLNFDKVKEIIIPSSVTDIYNNAFEGCSSLEKITLPITSSFSSKFNYEIPTTLNEIVVNGVGTLSQNSFSGCKTIQKVTLLEGMTTIGSYAFRGCTSLKTIVLPSTLENINAYAFENCTSLESVYFAGSIEDWMSLTLTSSNNPMTYAKQIYFLDGDEYKQITEIVIPEGVTTIGSYQFANFGTLTSVTLPASLTTVGDYAFANCSISSVYFNGNVEDWAAISFSVYDSNPMKFAENVYFFNGSEYAKVTDITINNTATIRYEQFVNFKDVTTINLSDNVTRIDAYAFRGCTKVESLTVPFFGTAINDTYYTYLSYLFGGTSYSSNANYVPTTLKEVTVTLDKEIPNDAFYKCSSITAVNVPSDIITIGSYAFSGCTSLTRFKIPSTVTSIGTCAFEGCTALEQIDIAEGVTKLSTDMLKGCTALEEVIIPSTVTKLTSILSGCTSLKKLTTPFVGEEVDSNTVYTSHIGVLFGQTDYSRINDSLPVSLKEVVITVDKTLNRYAFYKCSSITTVKLPSDSTSIGEYAFSGCTSLTGFEIPTTVTSIGQKAFAKCTSLSSIIIPISVTTMGISVFESSEITNIYCEAASKPSDWNERWHSDYSVTWGYTGQ